MSDGWLYHGTSLERAEQIARQGLVPHGPGYGTDQGAWPDGGKEKRSYFSASPKIVESFFPEDGVPVKLRTLAGPHFRAERHTGDIYTTKKITADKLQILGADDVWRSMLGGD